MPSTAGVVIGAATGGALGGFWVGADYGVMLGSIIGATASVVVSKDNNRRKIVHFFLALGAGMLIASSASELIQQVWKYNVSPKITAIAISAMLIPILYVTADRENILKAVRRISGIVERNFSALVDAVKSLRGRGDQ